MLQSLDVAGEDNDTPPDDARPAVPGALTTITLAPARPTPELSRAQEQKKARDRDYQRKKRASVRRRSTTGAESDEESVTAAPSVGGRSRKRARVGDDD
jgi:chromatin modification-related protein EAF6